MARDIRELFKDDKISHETMPENHEARFLKKLDAELPETKKSNFYWFQMAASVVLFLGLSFGAYTYFQPEKPIEVVTTNDVVTKTLGDISPGLKKVEDYYLASINLEFSKIKYTPETKDLFDSYIEQLSDLDEEYKLLSQDLTESGPSELTVNALIDNLKFRLNLLYRLKSQLEELSSSNTNEDTEQTT